MLWYEIFFIVLAGIAFLAYSAFIFWCTLKNDATSSNRILGVAFYNDCTIYFTQLTYKRGSYRLVAKDGVYLLPVNNTKVRFYDNCSHESK